MRRELKRLQMLEDFEEEAKKKGVRREEIEKVL